jgi:hypothetical protein
MPGVLQDCGKTLKCLRIKPSNVYELFDLYEFQRRTSYHCKCGIANRKTDSGMYSGYFYCQGLEQARKRYKEIREAATPIPVIIKRYCTEFEIGPTGIGPSNQIPELTEEQLAFERHVLNNYIGPERFIEPQDENEIRAVMLRWLFFARQHGDMTYKEFTNGKYLYAQFVTYHGE